MPHQLILPAIIFAATTIATIVFFLKAADFSKPAGIIVIGWVLLQGIISSTHFYENSTTIPPRFLLLVLPPLLCIVILFSTKRGRNFMDALQIKTLTILHIIRIPVEIVLYLLFLQKYVPELMTFEGRNPDIISGITAPIVFVMVFIKKWAGKKLLLVWNIICLVLLVNIVIIAVLSAPFQFQQFAFDQPNTGVLIFPFTLLPGCIVPLVLLAHAAAIRQLIRAPK